MKSSVNQRLLWVVSSFHTLYVAHLVLVTCVKSANGGLKKE